MHIDTVALLQSLGLMWKGMLSIFAVILVIYLVVTIMLRITANRKEDKPQE